jgi:hypothetical protein
LLGTWGFARSWRRERGTLWQLAVLWSAVFVFGRLIFYRRFFLHLDFFLLPFAAAAIADLWRRFPTSIARVCLIAALLLQAGVSAWHVTTRHSITDWGMIAAAERIALVVPEDAFVIGLDNNASVILRGWLPRHRVGGPGLFQLTWDVKQWEAFIAGPHEERVKHLSTLAGPVYIYAPRAFHDYYGGFAGVFLSDPCFEETVERDLYAVTCVSAPRTP